MPGEVIVKFQPQATSPQRNGILAARGARLIRRFGAVDLHHVRLAPGQSVDEAVAAFRAIPGVVLAQPNYIRKITATAPPNDPYWSFDLLWGLQKIQAQQTWTALTTGDPGIVVGDIDTGVNYTHPDLAANMWRNPGEIAGNNIDDDNDGYVDDVFGIDTINHDSDPMDDNGHGTHTAGTIAAVGNNGVGVVGVSWKTKILACKFVDASGSGTDAGAIECFNYVAALKDRGINIRVTNNSWGSPREDPPAVALQSAIDRAGAAGILNVFGAGNDGTNNDVTPFDPASFTSPSIVSVAASDQADAPADFSNYGGKSVDLAAPGVWILSTYNGSYAFASGTSMAAPHVSGAAALLAALDSTLSVSVMKALLVSSVDVLPEWQGRVLSGGRLNVFHAGNAVGGNTPPSVTLTSPNDGDAFPPSGTVTLEASASDAESTVSKVDFYVDGALVGTDTTAPYAVTWTTDVPGHYALTAVATDDQGASTTSNLVTVTVTPPLGRVNVALAANGATAVASATFNSDYPASGVTNGDRRGLQWGHGGGWVDATTNVWPDWLEVQFNGLQTIGEIDIFGVQDNYLAPSDPTPSMTFSQYGVRDFTVQYWTGSAWQTVPGGAVSGNTLVWRQFSFAPITTSRILISITNGLSSSSRLVEVEAYTAAPGANTPPSVTLTSPLGGDTFATPATVTLEATASDVEGTVSQVDFYANGTLVGTDATSPYTVAWTANVPGSYGLTAVATDDRGARNTSNAVTITMLPPPGRVNVALAANGATAVASSTYSSDYPASGVTNGDRRGLQWGRGGGWNDGTANAWPDWLEVQFNGLQTIGEIDVFSVQDDYSAPSEPTPSMTFSLYGVRDFTVQSWTGSAWQTVPGGAVSGNTLVRRQFNFAPITTSRIRISITNGLGSSSRLVEVEAYTAAPGANTPPSVTLTSPIGGGTFATPATVTLEATASDAESTVSKVDFYVNGALVGTDTAAPYSVTWTTNLPGNYSLTALATDDQGASTTSNLVTVTVTPPLGRVNVALAANGATAVASSTFNSDYPASGVTNGDRRGLQWGRGGGWVDGTANVWPDWLEVQFNGLQTIGEIDVFSVQDNYAAPSDPTPSMTFSQYGVRDFTVQYWTGSAWQTLPDGAVSGNTLVWRQFMFAPITTSRIRISITNGLASSSRLVEVEAYTAAPGANAPPSVALTRPTGGDTFATPATVTLEATASDVEGTVSQVEFYANGALVGTDTTSPYTVAWTANVPGSYALTAVATDDQGARKTSSAVNITMLPPPGRVNVALASNGATAVASSTYSSDYPASGVNDGDRRGLQWGKGGGWNDGTANVWPDWLEVQFNGLQTIGEIDVFSVQDNYAAPSDPTPTMTFSQYGVRDFTVQYWTGSGWQTVPGGAVSGNTLVWRQFSFAPITTSRIRISITNGLASSSRLVEVEAYTATGS